MEWKLQAQVTKRNTVIKSIDISDGQADSQKKSNGCKTFIRSLTLLDIPTRTEPLMPVTLLRAQQHLIQSPGANKKKILC